MTDENSPLPQPTRGPDELPEELDITVARPYKVPDNRKRRVAAACYVFAAVACGAGAAVSGNGGLLAGALFFALVAAHHLATAWPLVLDETGALAASAAATGFPVGHASAQLAWRGIRSRPVWRVLLYSADEPPSHARARRARRRRRRDSGQLHRGQP